MRGKDGEAIDRLIHGNSWKKAAEAIMQTVALRLPKADGRTNRTAYQELKLTAIKSEWKVVAASRLRFFAQHAFTDNSAAVSEIGVVAEELSELSTK